MYAQVYLKIAEVVNYLTNPFFRLLLMNFFARRRQQLTDNKLRYLIVHKPRTLNCPIS